MKNKKTRRLLSLFLTLTMCLSLLVIPATAAQNESELVDLNFDAEAAYKGQYEITVDDQVVKFDVYQATYCAKPISGLTWGEGTWLESSSEDYFKLNISVPVSVDGVECGDMSDAPILMYNPWGGDYGVPVYEPGKIGIKQSEMALARGFVVVEPGMRGQTFVGEYDSEEFYNYGKLPYPLVDLKAAIRYLRYGNNAETIPGDKEHIFFAGMSSGGDATVMIASSANNPIFDPYLEEIGAADTSDAVFAASPSCPVQTREWADAAIAWERWGVIGDDDANALPINKLYTEVYAEYQDGLGLTAEFAVPEAGIKVGDKLTSDNYADYLLVYVKQSAIKYLNSLGGKDAIDAYLASEKGEDMYGHPVATRTWIDPVYDGDVVVDVDFTWEEYWAYCVGDQDGVDTGTGHMDTSMLLNMQYDKSVLAPDEAMEGNSIINSQAGTMPFGSPYANASTFSFGKPNDLGMTFSVAGFKYLETLREPAVVLDDEYAELVEFQYNCTDPLYFLTGEGAEGSEPCKYWFMRTGSVDLVTPLPIFFNLATTLRNNGFVVDEALVWDQSHGLTDDLESFFAFAEEILAGEEAVLTSQALSVNGETVETEVYNIAGNNFFKLRDIAALLSDTYARFEVSYDEAERNVTVTTGEAYTPVGGELAKGEDKSDTCVVSTQTITIDGVVVDVAVYNIGGNNFFKLRDLGDAIGFGVDYDAETRTIIIET